ncbi:MAG: Lrp/AsnC family transcriptional regulator [Thermoplasmata archaeon]
MKDKPARKNVPSELAQRWEGLDLKLLPIDQLDIQILSMLRLNSRASNIEIAKELGISEATVRRRIKNLEQKGIIKGYSTYIDYQLIENPVKAYVHLSVSSEHRDEVVKRICQHSRAVAVYRVTGEYEILCVMLFVDMSEMQNFIDSYLKMDGINEVKTQIVMSPYKGVPWTGV